MYNVVQGLDRSIKGSKYTIKGLDCILKGLDCILKGLECTQKGPQLHDDLNALTVFLKMSLLGRLPPVSAIPHRGSLKSEALHRLKSPLQMRDSTARLSSSHLQLPRLLLFGFQTNTNVTLLKVNTSTPPSTPKSERHGQFRA